MVTAWGALVPAQGDHIPLNKIELFQIDSHAQEVEIGLLVIVVVIVNLHLKQTVRMTPEINKIVTQVKKAAERGKTGRDELVETVVKNLKESIDR